MKFYTWVGSLSVGKKFWTRVWNVESGVRNVAPGYTYLKQLCAHKMSWVRNFVPRYETSYPVQK
jgi:hypothetical protein